MAENKTKILIVDDDQFLLDMYSLKFSESGFEVIPCISADEALKKVEEGARPDIYLVDIIMQGMDGFQFTEEIARRGLKNGAAVVFLSNLGQQEDVDKGLALGVDGYIIKASATPSEVLAKVETIAKNKKGH